MENLKTTLININKEIDSYNILNWRSFNLNNEFAFQEINNLNNIKNIEKKIILVIIII